MEYAAKFDKECNTCVIKVSGEVNRPQDSQTLMALAQSLKAEHGCSKFLYDLRRSRIISSTMDTFETGISPKDVGFKRHDFQIALVYSGDMNEHRFMETVLVNRGFNVKVFDDMKEAENWLTQQ